MTSLQKSATVSDFNYKKRGPKRCPDVKIIIQSLKMEPVVNEIMCGSRIITCNTAKMFKSMIQHANDSGSMDTSLEYKPLSTKRSDPVPCRKVKYVEELREILKDNSNIQFNKAKTNRTSSKLPFGNRTNLLETPIDSKKKPKNSPKIVPMICEKFIDTVKLSKNLPDSSTPYRPKQCNETINNNTESDTNFMSSVQSIDSDTNNDFDKTLVKCYSMTRESCRRISSFKKSFLKPDCNSNNFVSTSSKFERRSLFTSSLNGTDHRSSIVSTDETSPLQRQRNIKSKNSKILNFFRSSKVDSSNFELRHRTNLAETCSNLSQMLTKSDHFDELGCEPLLTKNNIDYYARNKFEMDDCNEIIDWDNNFEFSFTCEPSTSDIREENEFEFLPIIEIQSKPSVVSFLNTPSIVICDAHQSEKKEQTNYNINSSPFRRSVSDPALIRLATLNNKNTFEQNCGIHFNDPSDFFDWTKANIVSHLTLQCAIFYI